MSAVSRGTVRILTMYESKKITRLRMPVRKYPSLTIMMKFCTPLKLMTGVLLFQSVNARTMATNMG